MRKQFTRARRNIARRHPAALARYGGNVSAAARALGVSRNTIYRRMAAVRRGRAAREN